MSTREFTVNVPNPSDGAVAPKLELEPVPDEELRALGYDLPPGTLEIRSMRMTTSASSSTLAGCVDAVRALVLAVLSWILRRPPGTGPRPLTVRLAPRTFADIRVRIDAIGQNGAVAVKLVDRRGGKIVGGVTLVVVDGPIDVHPGPIPSRNPTPLVLAEAPFWLPRDADPSTARAGGPVPAGYDVDLVAPITNPTAEPLTISTAYLEHLGGADAEFRPATFHLGTIEPGGVLPVRWRVQPGPWAEGRWTASIVVESDGFEPIRLRPAVEFGAFAPTQPLPDPAPAIG